MMVTFVSQCQKKALNRTRRVLDAFADRIGDNTWQTVITEEGLITVKKLLRKTATKNTAVSCHWIRSRSRSELVWVVGDRAKFNAQGIVPVNSTSKKNNHAEWENDWIYLPVIKALAAMAALLHDWGKATVLFQEKLISNTKLGDPIRHEWISCLLLNALVVHAGNTDEGWLNLLSKETFDEEVLKKIVENNNAKPLENLPPIAQLVGWLILVHHRLPYLNEPKNVSEDLRETMQRMLKSISLDWGYKNKQDDLSRLKGCFEFPHGLLSQSPSWLQQLKKWASKLFHVQSQIKELLDKGTYRVILHHARLCLMLGDHYYSSCEADKKWEFTTELYANTETKKDDNGKRLLKQKLDEHLVRVSSYTLKISQSLSRFSTDMDFARDIKRLKQKSPKGFEWQDKAVEKIKIFKGENSSVQDKENGWFIVNMASTGSGKTIANAKIMRALSADNESLRFILALGLRTLTLQTGDEYRERIGLDKDELAVLIGSSVIKELHERSYTTENKSKSFEKYGSESLEELLEEDLEYESAPHADFLDAIIPKYDLKRAEKNKAFLYKPVLVCTIDHIIAATETIRGGKYILPSLRLLSSDLVIDEVDDFDGKDLIAIGRLIHLAGMLGRKVMISSATIPPSVAEGFLNVYQAGWKLYAAFKNITPNVFGAWIDEFDTDIQWLRESDSIKISQAYQNFHKKFVISRIGNLKKQPVKRRGYIVPFNLGDKNNQESERVRYFQKIKETAIDLHSKNYVIDKKTGKQVSFGVIRVANIPPCVVLTKFLLEAEWEADVTPKIMAYHSRQILLLRHEQEKHLDAVLKRKGTFQDKKYEFTDPIIRNHIDSVHNQNIIFILVATPVEEIGRDHDFDWAIIEPSSYRSIIQLAGRVLRHRFLKNDIEHYNIAIMQYNLKALRQDGKPSYCRPGYEANKTLRLDSSNMFDLVNEEILKKAINAIPRIQQPETFSPQKKLADLEHHAISKSLTQYTAAGPQSLQAWLNECWWLTAIPQQLNRFRESNPDITLYLVWIDGRFIFCEKNEVGEFTPVEKIKDIQWVQPLDESAQSKLWLERNYYHSLLKLQNSCQEIEAYSEVQISRFSQRYGEITVPDNNNKLHYSDHLGLFQDC